MGGGPREVTREGQQRGVPWEAGLQRPGVWMLRFIPQLCSRRRHSHRDQGTRYEAGGLLLTPGSARLCVPAPPREHTQRHVGCVLTGMHLCLRHAEAGHMGRVSARLLLHMCMRMWELCVRTHVHKVWHRHAHMFRLRACARTEVPHPTLAVAVGWWRWSGHLGNWLSWGSLASKEKKKIKPLNTKRRRSWRVVRVRLSPRLRSRLPPQPTHLSRPSEGRHSQDTGPRKQRADSPWCGGSLQSPREPTGMAAVRDWAGPTLQTHQAPEEGTLDTRRFANQGTLGRAAHSHPLWTMNALTACAASWPVH